MLPSGPLPSMKLRLQSVNDIYCLLLPPKTKKPVETGIHPQTDNTQWKPVVEAIQLALPV